MKRFSKKLENLQKKKKVKYNTKENNWEQEAARLEVTVDYYMAEFL